jgi:hypothetical protein
VANVLAIIVDTELTEQTQQADEYSGKAMLNLKRPLQYSTIMLLDNRQQLSNGYMTNNTDIA